MISPLSKLVMSSHEFSFGGKTRGGLCAQEVGTWAWIHHAQVPLGGDIGMIFPGREAPGGFLSLGVSRHFTPAFRLGSRNGNYSPSRAHQMYINWKANFYFCYGQSFENELQNKLQWGNSQTNRIALTGNQWYWGDHQLQESQTAKCQGNIVSHFVH